jgi:hypothetical protein
MVSIPGSLRLESLIGLLASGSWKRMSTGDTLLTVAQKEICMGFLLGNT